MALIKTVLIFLLIFFAFRIIWRLAKPYIFRYLAKKAGQKFQKMAGDFKSRAQSSAQPEGKTTIHKASDQPKSKKNVGEYIDYEEID